MPDKLLALLMSGRARIYGMTLLELYHHIQPLVGDGGAFYRYEMDAFARYLGLRGESANQRIGSIWPAATRRRFHSADLPSQAKISCDKSPCPASALLVSCLCRPENRAHATNHDPQGVVSCKQPIS